MAGLLHVLKPHLMKAEAEFEIVAFLTDLDERALGLAIQFGPTRKTWD